jgi:hypothetical protein
MSHLDEGTIHAWLDGALPPEEAARVETHARECAECSAMVAEARGFMAGASRIVSSLDIVRGDVIPATPAASPTPVGRGSLWRSRTFTPARASIAATILVGVASMFSLAHQDAKLASPAARLVSDTAAVTASAPATAPVVPPAPSPLQAQRAAPTQRRPAAASEVASTGASNAASNAADVAKPRLAVADSAPPSSSAGGVAGAAAPTAPAERKFAAAAAPASVPPTVAEPAPAPARLPLRDTTLRLTEVVVTGLAQRTDSSAAARASKARGSAAGATAADAVDRSARRLAVRASQPAIEASVPGCYRLRVDPPVDLRGFPTDLRLKFDSTNGSHPVFAINADRDSVLSGAGWRVVQGTTVVVGGTDTRFGSVDISFSTDSARAIFRSMGGTGPATMQRISCPR